MVRVMRYSACAAATRPTKTATSASTTNVRRCTKPRKQPPTTVALPRRTVTAPARSGGADRRAEKGRRQTITQRMIGGVTSIHRNCAHASRSRRQDSLSRRRAKQRRCPDNREDHRSNRPRRWPNQGSSYVANRSFRYWPRCPPPFFPVGQAARSTARDQAGRRHGAVSSPARSSTSGRWLWHGWGFWLPFAVSRWFKEEFARRPGYTGPAVSTDRLHARRAFSKSRPIMLTPYS